MLYFLFFPPGRLVILCDPLHEHVIASADIRGGRWGRTSSSSSRRRSTIKLQP